MEGNAVSGEFHGGICITSREWFCSTLSKHVNEIWCSEEHSREIQMRYIYRAGILALGLSKKVDIDWLVFLVDQPHQARNWERLRKSVWSKRSDGTAWNNPSRGRFLVFQGGVQPSRTYWSIRNEGLTGGKNSTLQLPFMCPGLWV